MVQKAMRSEASSLNSLGPKRDWPEVHGEESRPRTVLSWPLAKWVVGESEEAGRRTLSSHGSENPEEKEIALSLRKWRNRNKVKWKILHRGKERRCSRRLLRKSKEQPCLGDGGVEKACLVDVLHLCQVEPEMALLDYYGGGCEPRPAPRNQSSSHESSGLGGLLTSSPMLMAAPPHLHPQRT